MESYKSTSAIRVLPIINEDETVYGVASPESILSHIKSNQKFCQLKAERFLALSEVSGMEQPYTLLPSDTLAQARFAMKYLPIESQLTQRMIRCYDGYTDDQARPHHRSCRPK